MWAALKGHINSTRILLDNGADMVLRDSDGDTTLTRAAHAGYADIVSELLSRGAQEDVTNNARETARQGAEAYGYFDVLSLFSIWHTPESRDERLFQASDEEKVRQDWFEDFSSLHQARGRHSHVTKPFTGLPEMDMLTLSVSYSRPALTSTVKTRLDGLLYLRRPTLDS